MADELKEARKIAEWMKGFCTTIVDQHGNEYILVNHPKYPEHKGVYSMPEGKLIKGLDPDAVIKKLEELS